jgi:hypothetical protein
MMVATVSLTALAGGILFRATAPLVGTITGAFSGPLLLLLVGQSLEGPILHVSGEILCEGSTNWVEIFPDVFVCLIAYFSWYD